MGRGTTYERTKFMGTMRVLDETGDTAVMWAPTDEETTVRAEKLFKRLIGERQMAFGRKAGDPVEEAERLDTFDPTLDEIVWVRPIQGG
jgi:hypothetical protein